MKSKKTQIMLVLFFVAIAAVEAYLFLQVSQPRTESLEVLEVPEATVQSAQAAEEPQSLPAEEPPDPLVFTIAGGGDFLIHTEVGDSAWAGDGWDFRPLFAPMDPYIQGADLAICNLEVPLLHPGETPTGFPVFGAPEELGAAIAAGGWDGCSTSTNHSVDQGYRGLVHTLDVLDREGLGHVGTARSTEEAESAQMYVVEGEGQQVTVANIAGTYGLNGFPTPEGAPWSVEWLDADRLIQQATKAREEGADMVVASVHCCGPEYSAELHPWQVEIAEQLAQSGVVDLIIGHHAHWPLPIDYLEGGPNGNGMWVAFGTGNFVSSMWPECCGTESLTGIVAYFTVVKEADEPPKIVEATWQGATVDTWNGHLVTPLLPDGSGSTTLSLEQQQYRHQLLMDIMGDSPATQLLEPPTKKATTTVIPRAS